MVIQLAGGVDKLMKQGFTGICSEWAPHIDCTIVWLVMESRVKRRQPPERRGDNPTPLEHRADHRVSQWSPATHERPQDATERRTGARESVWALASYIHHHPQLTMVSDLERYVSDNALQVKRLASKLCICVLIAFAVLRCI